MNGSEDRVSVILSLMFASFKSYSNKNSPAKLRAMWESGVHIFVFSSMGKLSNDMHIYIAYTHTYIYFYVCIFIYSQRMDELAHTHTDHIHTHTHTYAHFHTHTHTYTHICT